MFNKFIRPTFGQSFRGKIVLYPAEIRAGEVIRIQLSDFDTLQKVTVSILDSMENQLFSNIYQTSDKGGLSENIVVDTENLEIGCYTVKAKGKSMDTEGVVSRQFDVIGKNA